MTDQLSRRLAGLRKDFAEVTGAEFGTFYCPMLYRDDPVPLCKGHVINRAFRVASRRWTVQRKDVDGFFGVHFESEFVILQERGLHTPLEVLTDPALAKKLRPNVTRDGRRVEHFKPRGPAPAHFSPVVMEQGGKQVELVLKLSPSEALASLDQVWNVEVSRDLRLPALVSLLKAAHLTLFTLLGYRYALSAGGHFLGNTVLGQFFTACSGLDHATILDRALPHFSEYIPMVRPMESAPGHLRGTVVDRKMYMCGPAGRAWGMMVLMRMGPQVHSVLVPVFQTPDSIAHFLEFLQGGARFIEMRLVRYIRKQFEASPKSKMVWWPEARFDEPPTPS